MRSTTMGTANFVTRYDAVRYYAKQEDGLKAADAAVTAKLAAGEIFIGPPALKAGETLSTIDDGTRYAITTNEEG
jgi:hypothetical protein